MSIYEDAKTGNLVRAKLDEYVRSNPNILETQDPDTGLTPLGIAVVEGYAEEVRQLLQKGAKADTLSRNRESPLILAARRTTRERPLIIQLLLAKLPASLVDQRSPPPDNKTALMYAVENEDLESIRLLRKVGASVTITNDDGLTVSELAERAQNKAVKQALDPAERDNRAMLADIVVSVLLYIIAWVNKALNGVVRRLGGPSGEENASIEQAIGAPADASKDEFLEKVDGFVKGNPTLEGFFGDKPNFIQDLAANAAALKDADDTDLGDSDVLPKVMKISMYQQVIYCDDSSSMKREGRWEAQKDLVGRITKITTKILPDGEGVALRFINRDVDNAANLSSEAVGQIMDPMPWQPGGDTMIGTNLRAKILQPLVYAKFEPRDLPRPLLVCIITDGGPEPEKTGELANAIVECGLLLEAAGFPRKSVMFLIGQIGTSNRATGFLRSLKDNAEIAPYIYVITDKLDEKFAELRDNERQVERWLVDLLFTPIKEPEEVV